MRFVAVTIVNDEGAAQVASEMLAEAGIAVEARHLRDPYFGGGPRVEVRVPADRLQDAEALLSILGEESQTAAAGQAQALSIEDVTDGEGDVVAEPADLVIRQRSSAERRAGIAFIVFILLLVFSVLILRGIFG